MRTHVNDVHDGRAAEIRRCIVVPSALLRFRAASGPGTAPGLDLGLQLVRRQMQQDLGLVFA